MTRQVDTNLSVHSSREKVQNFQYDWRLRVSPRNAVNCRCTYGKTHTKMIDASLSDGLLKTEVDIGIANPSWASGHLDM